MQINIFSKRIKYLRKMNNYTQEQLAEKVNKAQSTVRMWELNKSQPDLDTILLIANVFKVSTDYLLGNSSIENTTQDDHFKYVIFDEIKDIKDESLKENVIKIVKTLKRMNDE